MNAIARFATALLATLIGVGCAKGPSGGGGDGGDAGPPFGLTPEKASQPLAKIDERVITVGEFAEKLAQQHPQLRARYSSPERRRELLDQMIRIELVAREAARRGYMNDPQVQQMLKQEMVNTLLKREFEERVRLADITEEEMRRYFDEHPNEFNIPEQVHAAHVVVRDRPTADRVLREALVKAGDATAFRNLARQYSTDESTKNLGGDLRFFSRPNERRPGEPDLPADVANAAFTMQTPGQVHADVIQSDRGFHVLKLLGKRRAINRSFDEVKRMIQSKLWNERRQRAMEEFVQQLRDRTRVEIYNDALAKVELRLPPEPRAGSPRMPGMPLTPSGLGGVPGGTKRPPAAPRP